MTILDCKKKEAIGSCFSGDAGRRNSNDCVAGHRRFWVCRENHKRQKEFPANENEQADVSAIEITEPEYSTTCFPFCAFVLRP